LPGPDKKPRLCDATHPVIRTHPESERLNLFVIDYTARIVGMPLEESDALIAELKSFVDTYAALYSHNWEPGDLMMWDNVGLHHKRPAVEGSFRRVMRQYEGVAEA
ncbi:MAG: TauD/TfdA family dioxygenase, partial [Novosphingobium sp.]|nr:TauD/TfdA family dioxygenase [Novosphingobium sp.]